MGNARLATTSSWLLNHLHAKHLQICRSTVANPHIFTSSVAYCMYKSNTIATTTHTFRYLRKSNSVASMCTLLSNQVKEEEPKLYVAPCEAITSVCWNVKKTIRIYQRLPPLPIRNIYLVRFWHNQHCSIQINKHNPAIIYSYNWCVFVCIVWHWKISKAKI